MERATQCKVASFFLHEFDTELDFSNKVRYVHNSIFKEDSYNYISDEKNYFHVQLYENVILSQSIQNIDNNLL